MATTESADPDSVSSVAFRAPPFLKSNPRAWFLQMESCFKETGTKSDDRKFHRTVSALEAEVVIQVVDILANPPATDKYAALKERVMECYADSESKRLQTLLQGISLGDRRPSQLLREMRDLAGERMDDSLLKDLWLQRLPAHVRAVLVLCPSPLTALAGIADKVCEANASPPNYAVAAVASSKAAPPAPSSGQPPVEELVAMVAALRADFQKLSNKLDAAPRRNRSSSRRRSGSRHRSQSPSPTANPDHCWYHQTFGGAARKCKSPCSFVAGN